MAIRKTLVATTGSLALCVAMAIPAMGASPTYSGTLSCTNLNGEQVELEAVSGASRKVIAERRSFWRGTGFCASGSFDTSGLSRDA